MCGSTFLLLLAMIAALVLLVLVTVSVPFIQALYFLRTSAEGGVKFGVLGFCRDSMGICDKGLGYHFDPQLMDSLTIVLVLYPVAAGLSLLAALTLLPIFFSRHRHTWPYVVFALLSTLAFLASAAAFAITMWLFTVAMERFHAQGSEAAYGPSIWISLAATLVLFAAALNGGCATCVGGRCGRLPRHLTYTY